MKIGIVAGVFVAAFLGWVAYSTVHGPSFRAEICMSFEGRHACKTVSSKSEAGAIRAGTDGSCADIASGVTDTMKCVSSEPESVKWLKRP